MEWIFAVITIYIILESTLGVRFHLSCLSVIARIAGRHEFFNKLLVFTIIQIICCGISSILYNINYCIVPQIRNPTKVSERCGPNRQECDFSSSD